MLVTCPRDALLNACQVLTSALPARTTLTIYQNVKAISDGTELVLMATDLEVGIRYTLRGLNVQQAGEAIWPVGRLTAILRETVDSELKIDSNDTRIRVTTSSGTFDMPAEDPTAFADIPDFPEADRHLELLAGDLKRMIPRTVFAAARDEGKYAMRGVLWDLEGTTLGLVATDGKRLAIARQACTVQGKGDKKGQSHLVPVKAMTLLERIIGEGDAEQIVQVALRPNEALFRTERAVIVSRLVEGRFPPYRDVIPKKANARIPLRVGPFYSAVRQAAIMTDEESKRIAFTFAAGKVVLEASGATTGQSKVTLPLEGYEGPEVKINFDPSYLTDMLRVLNGDDALQLELVDSERPGVFRLGDEYAYLVVPLY